MKHTSESQGRPLFSDPGVGHAASERHAVAAAVWDSFSRHVSSGAAIVLGVSGGADSTALLLAATAAAARGGWRLHVVHVHHGLRSNADLDAEFVSSLCSIRNVPCNVVRVELETSGRGAEAAARDARYAALRQCADDLDTPFIAVAHTRDDQIETFFLHLFRGTGLTGLAGMPEHRADGLLRPLLSCRRAETEDYCRRHGVAWRTDESNSDTTLLRNRIRHRLLPLLESEFGGHAVNAVARAMDILRTDDELLTSALDRELAGAADNALSRSLLLRLPVSLQRRAIRRLAQANGCSDDLSLDHIEAIRRRLTQDGESWQLYLPHGCRAQAELDVLTIRPRGAEIPIGVPVRTLPVPGRIHVPELGAEVRATVSAAAPSQFSTNPFEATIRLPAPAAALQVRSPRPGDRFHPLGAPGSRKLNDFLLSRRVPASKRPEVLLVCDDSGILWVAGHQIDERAKLTENTDHCVTLTISFSPHST